ncbi:CRTAC1 family protein [Thermogutta sp.]|uniref:CRTAC1 family protein n=2 Tax=Thermogutta sp. TaxID=1962930 RepID=UPI00321FF41B
MSAGLLLFDYNNDGWIDIYFLNGAPLPGYTGPPSPRNHLYRNLGNWRFVDATDQAGVGDTGYGLGVAAADFDNDGDEDIYVNNFGPNVFYRNNGDGTFTDVTHQTGTANGEKMGAGVCFVDIDRDGWVDLYVGNYIHFTFDQHISRTINAVPSYPGPLDYTAVPDTLYHNQRDGTFADISGPSGISQLAGTTMGMVAGDFDNDGDDDIFICNDVRENFLLINDGFGHFEEAAILRGVAYDASGSPQASMGVDCGDLNRDGWLDLFMTSYQNETVTFYRNLGKAFFEDATAVTGAGAGSYPYVTWGVVLADFDNDGDKDVFIACGHLDDNVELRDRSTSYRAKNIVLKNQGDGRFVNVSAQSGDGLQVAKSSRGAAGADLDNDGRIDIVVVNSRDSPTILHNETPTPYNWLELLLEGRASNRSAIGAKVKVVAGDLVQYDEVHSGRGYQSDWGRRLHFGLREHNEAQLIEVTWPTGRIERWSHIPANRIVKLIEGETSWLTVHTTPSSSSPQRK